MPIVDQVESAELAVERLEQQVQAAVASAGEVRAIFTDLDDTLWRWPLIYVEPMRKMLSAISDDYALDFNKFTRQVKAVHRAHSDTEYPLSILETPIVQTMCGTKDKKRLKEDLQPYIDIFNQTRQDNLLPALYGRVHDALSKLKAAGIHLLAYTDATACAVTRNLHEYGLVNFFDKVVCRGDHELLPGVHDTWLKARAAFKTDQLVILPPEMHKPQPEVLDKLLHLLNEQLVAEGAAANDLVTANQVLWMGDSLNRDMKMAQDYNATLANPNQKIRTVHAEYGAFSDLNGVIIPDARYDKCLPADYTKEMLIAFLLKISYWSDKQEEDEGKTKTQAHQIERSVVLEKSYDELLSYPPVAQTLLAARAAANSPIVTQFDQSLETAEEAQDRDIDTMPKLRQQQQ